MWQLIARFLARPTAANWIIRRAQRRPYDFLVIEGERILKMPNDYPPDYYGHAGYMRRWWLVAPLPFLELRVHQIMAPDPGRDMHSHPWPFRTFILKGGYLERQYWPRSGDWTTWHQAGDTTSLGRERVHRIEQVAPDTWTLFITFGRRGKWGFRVNGKLVDHKEYHG